MHTPREDRLRDIFEEIARGSSLDSALGAIADHTAAYLGAPTCKIWVVKRGDICDRCPLASICSNRQMCMHLIAASGAAVEREYQRVPLSLFNASLIARGGASDFTDPNGLGEKLFGLQHGAQSESRDSYALYPLRGTSGTIGLIGVFNHRPIEQAEIRWLAQLAPAAVAAIRVAELQSRCDSFRSRLQKETSLLSAVEQTARLRERELEDAVAQLTQQVAHLRVEREPLIRANVESSRRIAQIETEAEQINRANIQLEQTIKELREHNESLLSVQQESGRTYSEMASNLEAERNRMEEERAWLKGQLAAQELSAAELGKLRDALSTEVNERNGEIYNLRTELEKRQSELNAAREALPRLEERAAALKQENAELREQTAAITESIKDLENSLRIAEDGRARLEQIRISLEEKYARQAEELERLRLESNRVNGENEQLIIETERLRGEMEELRRSAAQASEEGISTAALNREMAEALSASEGRLRELEQENASLVGVNAQLEEAAHRLEEITTRMEESTLKLRDRAEASERARAELEQRNRTLVEQNRRLIMENQARARFLADMSHELRTPMNAIIGFTSLLADDRSLQLSDRHRRSLDRVSRNARDLLELINNMLDLSKIEAGRMDVFSEPADARDLIERALGVVEPLKEGRAIDVVVEIEENLPSMKTDRVKLQQILINLLSNALKFTPEGTVGIKAERAGEDRIRLSISDTGVGIDESDLPKIFDEFRQVGASRVNSRRGTGLGLAITRRLVALLGGEIGVVSRFGEGSVFTVTLPLRIDGRAAEQISADLPTDPELTALVIEADPATLYLTKKYLMEAGYSVATTDDPARGAEIVRLAKPALITVDLDSPEAIDLLSQLTETGKPGKVVAFSADPGIERQAIRTGASAFLRKPVDRAELFGFLEKARKGPMARVLAVDDDPDALDLVVAMLEGSGYEIERATNGREALRAIEQSRPDAIILDLMLPEMDGFEVIHRLSLKADWRTIPVILLTARDLSHEERRALDIGTARIIQKGNFSRDELVAEVAALTGAGSGESIGAAS